MEEKTTNTSLESKTGEVEVRKGSSMLSREIVQLVNNIMAGEEYERFNTNTDLREHSYMNILDHKGRQVAGIYSETDGKSNGRLIHSAVCAPITINAYTPLALERAKVFAKSYKELTGKDAVVYQQFVPEDFIPASEVKAEESKEETLEERTASKERTEVKFRGSSKSKENHGFLRGFYTATVGELAAKAVILVATAVGGFLLSEYKHNSEAQPAAEVSVEQKEPLVNEIYKLEIADEKPAEKSKIRFD